MSWLVLALWAAVVAMIATAATRFLRERRTIKNGGVYWARESRAQLTNGGVYWARESRGQSASDSEWLAANNGGQSPTIKARDEAEPIWSVIHGPCEPRWTPVREAA